MQIKILFINYSLYVAYTWSSIIHSSHSPCDRNYTVICIQPQCIPHSNRSIHNIVMTRWLTCMLRITTIHWITLVHHFRSRTHPILCCDANQLSTSWTSVVPSSGQRHHSFWVIMVLSVALRRTTSVSS
jgi:hypothetical protein